jgi:hypothetical protein
VFVTLVCKACKDCRFWSTDKTKFAGYFQALKTKDMERVETLSDRLRAQLDAGASAEELLLTVQMLQSELLHAMATEKETAPRAAVAIQLPDHLPLSPAAAESAAPEAVEEEEKLVFELNVEEEDVEAELEEIRRNAEISNKISSQNRPQIFFDPVEDTPTLIHQRSSEIFAARELHEAIAGPDQGSVNDALRPNKTELSDALKDLPIKDMRKAIGINDRFSFIKELFRGDETMYERSIKTINSFAIYPEAEYWIKRELKLKLGWDDKDPIVRQFDQVVKRRFSAT